MTCVVDNIKESRAALAARGVAVREIDDMGGVLYVYFSDPEGKEWLPQEILARFK